MAHSACGDELYSVGIVAEFIFFLLSSDDIGCRFQIVVLSAYKQIRSQSADILSDIDEDNYDRAFNFLRPGKSHRYLVPY